jgi:uncharacterized protein
MAMFKTVSTDCNLDCSYCYYRQSFYGSRVRHRMTEEMLEAFIPQCMEYVSDVGVASFSWQGGEPTLAGLDFFRRAVELQRRSARPGTAIQNALQTNGVLIDDEWSRFLSESRFLVGVSLDGPQSIHDAHRKDRRGQGSFARVMRGIDALRRRSAEFNILCVLTSANVGQARRLMSFFRSEGCSHVQFIPAMDFQAMQPGKPASYLITPEEYGGFLCETFDEWYMDGGPRLSVSIFDNYLQAYLGLPVQVCIYADTCDSGITVEYNGDLYPCDFYVHPDWRLGNALEEPLADILNRPERAAFIAQKRPFPHACRSCEWSLICKGGCFRNRTALPGGGSKPDYFCQSYKPLMSHADERFRRLRDTVLRRHRYLNALAPPAGAAAPGRNDPCPCGSGRKHKHCCGRPQESQSYVFRDLGGLSIQPARVAWTM